MRLELIEALLQTIPFFVVALVATKLIDMVGYDDDRLQSIVHYAIGSVSLTFYPLLFIAFFLVSQFLGSLITLPFII